MGGHTCRYIIQIGFKKTDEKNHPTPFTAGTIFMRKKGLAPLRRQALNAK